MTPIDICRQLHPRLTVVPVDASVRALVRSALAPVAHVVDAAALDERTAETVRHRSDADANRIADLEVELAAVEQDHAEAADRHRAIRDEHDRLVADADWCERQPADLGPARAQEAEALLTVEQRTRASRSASRDLDRVLEQRAAAEAALEEARQQLASVSGDPDQAAVGLAQQVEAVEARLREAEDTARLASEDATLQLSRAELALERIRHDARTRRARAEDLLARLPEGSVPDVHDDALAGAEAIGQVLRTMADQRVPELEDAASAVDEIAAEVARRSEDLERRRACLGVAVADDEAEALASFLDDDGADLVVLDGVLDHDPDLARRRIVAVAAGPQVVVLSDDVDVLAWSIDLPADHGAVTSASALIAISGHFDLMSDEDLATAMETTP